LNSVCHQIGSPNCKKGYLDLQGRGVLNDLYLRVGDKIYQFEKIVDLGAEIAAQTQNLNVLRSTYKTENENRVKFDEELRKIQTATLETQKGKKSLGNREW
jgi:hypothetical protein